MATYTPAQFGQVGLASSMPKVQVIDRVIDFAVRNVNTGDTMKVLQIPANSLVLYCNYQTLATVAGSTGTFVIADTTLGVSYVASAVAVAAASNGVAAITVPKIYSAVDTLVIKTVATANLVSGKLRVFMVIADLNGVDRSSTSGGTTTQPSDFANWIVS